MRISDWSSDVCSSDLHHAGAAGVDRELRVPGRDDHHERNQPDRQRRDRSDDRVANSRAAMVWPRPLSAGRRHRAGVRRGRLVNLTGTTGALLDAYNRHDVETVASLYTADGTHEDMAPNKSKVGAAAIAAGLSTFFGWFPDAHWTPRKLIDGRTASADRKSTRLNSSH